MFENFVKSHETGDFTPDQKIIFTPTSSCSGGSNSLNQTYLSIYI